MAIRIIPADNLVLSRVAEKRKIIFIVVLKQERHGRSDVESEDALIEPVVFFS